MEGFLVCTGKNRTDNNSMPRAVFWYVGGLVGICTSIQGQIGHFHSVGMCKNKS